MSRKATLIFGLLIGALTQAGYTISMESTTPVLISLCLFVGLAIQVVIALALFSIAFKSDIRDKEILKFLKTIPAAQLAGMPAGYRHWQNKPDNTFEFSIVDKLDRTDSASNNYRRDPI